MPPTCDRVSAIPVGRVTTCASPPGTSTRSAPASTASRTGWPRPTSTCWRCRRPRARDDQFPHDRSGALGYEVAHHGINQWNGVAIVSRVGLDDVQVGFDGDPGWGDAAGRRGTGDRRDVQRRAGVEPLRAERPHARRPAHTPTSWSGWLALRDAGQRLAADGTPVALVRRLEHRAAGRRRLVDGVLPRQHATSPPASAPPSTPSSTPASPTWCGPHTPGPGVYTYWDYTAAGLPQAARHAHRLRPRLTGVRQRASRARRSTARSARATAPATTRPSSCSWTD